MITHKLRRIHKRIIEHVGSGLAKKIYHLLLPDFPATALQWIKNTHFEGPMEVPHDQIDFSNRQNWKASHEPEKVKDHMELIEEGESKPVLLAKIPGNDKFIHLDGAHRMLAAEALNKPVLAYIAYPTGSNIEAAITMHSFQYTGRSRLDGT